MMRIGKWVLGIVALVMLFGSVAEAQIQANTLCVNGGDQYYVNGPFYGYPNHGASKYFPSFTHIPAAPVSQANLVYPWKIAGWAWTGMQATSFGPIWYWESCLQASMDNPGVSAMTYDYPVSFCTGAVPHTGAPQPTYGGSTPSVVPIVGDQNWLYPSSFGGHDAYLNIFAVGGASWLVPSTAAYQGVQFGFNFDCASAITVPSGNSILQFTWNMFGPFGQYVTLGPIDTACIGGSGNKGRNYSLISDSDNGYIWYWNNTCTGIGQEWVMCLWVCDTVTIPVNAPGTTHASNPFLAYNFSVGQGTLTPLLSSNCVQMGFMSQDYTGLQGPRMALAAFAFSPTAPVPYAKKGSRLPHGYDLLTNIFLNVAQVFMHVPQPGYPACMFGTTIGAHSAFLPFPYDPVLLCAEIKYSTFSPSDNSSSAAYQVCYF